MNKPNYNILTPFKRWTIQNFPFIEEDFDAITNYQLLSKIVEYLNKVVENEKELEKVNNELIDAFNNLKSYVDNYFEELDVQDEIDNKLDEMAESGQLTDIIAQYLGLAGVLAFNTIADLSDALNIDNGSICYTLGQNSYNDGKGAFYKIRTVTSGDVVDGFNIVALDVSETLIAERIPNYYINEINNNINNLNNKINDNERNAIYLGNSYTDGVGSTDGQTGLFALTKNLFKNSYKFTGSGTGFLAHTDHENNTFLTHLQDAIDDTSINKDSITDIIIIGAYGDSSAYHEFGKDTFLNNMNTALATFMNMINSNYPNVKRVCYVWAEGREIQNPTMGYISTLSDEFNIHNLFKFLLPRNGIEYLGWIGFNITLSETYFSNDKVHPNDIGYKYLASNFKSSYCGNLTYKPKRFTQTSNFGITQNSSVNSIITIEPDKWYVTFTGANIKTGNTNAFNTEVDIFDFTSSTYCLPLPFDVSEIDFGSAFRIETTKPSSASYDPSKIYVGKILFRKSSNNLSTTMKILNASMTRTISEEIILAVITPLTIMCDLEYR